MKTWWLCLLLAWNSLASAQSSTAALGRRGAPCSSLVQPSNPTRLTASAGDRRVELCWAPPTNNGCTDSYLVTVTNTTLGRPNIMFTQQFNSSGCFNFTQGLANNLTYQFAVQALSAGPHAPSPAATVLAQPAQPVITSWTCLPIPAFYPLCDSALTGACNPLNCKEQKFWGRCDAPFMRQIHYDTQTIIQYCSEECGCLATPPPEPNLVTKFSGPAPTEPTPARTNASMAELERKLAAVTTILPCLLGRAGACEASAAAARETFNLRCTLAETI